MKWGEFVKLGYLREYRHAGVTLQGLRPFATRLRDEFGIPHPLAHRGVYLAERRQLVVIDPARAFGIPTIRGIRPRLTDRGGCAMASHWHRTS